MALAAQGFGVAAPSVVGPRQLQRVVDQIGQVQIDSVNVAVRAHYMPLFARLGPYDTALLDRAAGRAPRRLFEYWGHAASLIDVGLQPALRFRMAAHGRGEPWPAIQKIRVQHPHLEQQVLDLVGERGPLTARQIEHPEDRVRAPWWNWSQAKHVLEWLFATGELTAAGRNAQFERLYDLPGRVLPAAVAAAPTPDDAEAARILVRRAAAALGIATDRCLADYFRLSLDRARSAIADLADAGELIETPVRGWGRRSYLWHQARLPRRLTVDALVSPFDSLVFERSRLADLFGVDYRIEIYTPAAQRVYGYYVYLFVTDERVAARVDLKADRQAGALLVQASWLEPGAPEAETAGRLAQTLRSMADWLGLTDVLVRPVGTLAAPLAALTPRP
ncbi:MAG: crosslink repair DNA glycosylase YcaQ family protein [Propionicimonas sp.]|uniref:winged helix-turn-helix domain-containing protein n=1 Tax=Propionicimonas sp. TaxID=1955623 RepID=UPI002B1F9052|nr:crosslink repair DNA glycosylase YcaQ family protein [Propionicimonas sp.]MEA4944690.1 crosslink repair DNA glycosylase YcaQ family protein [Propionicimonas sp.]MEA5055753.1 crosslink repair DNA glycosylase YcaQ family protein [Propionicimonas sp.]